MNTTIPEFWVLVVGWALVIGGLTMLWHLAGLMIGIGTFLIFTFSELHVVSETKGRTSIGGETCNREG